MIEPGDFASRFAAPMLLIAFIVTACTSPVSRPRASDARPPSDPQRTQLHRVFRPELGFADGRTQRAGVAFVLDAGGGQLYVATSGHLARNLMKGSDLAHVRLVDNATGAVVGDIDSLAGEPGATFDGLDYSTDIALLNFPHISDSGPPFVPATTIAHVGDEVEITACPADRSGSAVRLTARVEGSDATLLRVRLHDAADTRAFAGAPIVLISTGELVGMVQTVSGGVALATPGSAIALRTAATNGALPVSAWK